MHLGWGRVNHRRHFDLRIKGPKADEALTDRLDSSSRVLFVPGCHHEERLAVWAVWGAEVGAGWGWWMGMGWGVVEVWRFKRGKEKLKRSQREGGRRSCCRNSFLFYCSFPPHCF